MFSLSVPISCSFISIVHHDPNMRGFQSQNGPKVGCTTSLPSGKPTYLWKIHENPNVYNKINKYKSAFNSAKVGIQMYSDVFLPFWNINSPTPASPKKPGVPGIPRPDSERRNDSALRLPDTGCDSCGTFQGISSR